MDAIEFMAQENDGVIKIPQKYRKGLTKEFRVIILIELECNCDILYSEDMQNKQKIETQLTIINPFE